MAQVQKNGGTVNGVTNIVPTLGSATTAGNSIIILVCSAGVLSTPSGFTSRSPQVNILGGYLFEKLVASGNSTDLPTMAQGGTFNAVWFVAEYSGMTAYKTSTGVAGGNGVNGSYSTGSITPSAGATLLIGYDAVTAQFSNTYGANDPTSWTNSFTSEQSLLRTGVAGSGRDSFAAGWATRQVTADGSTSYSTAATHTASGNDAAPHRIIAAYAHSAGGAATSRPVFSRPARFITRSF
jgi:hypothetical protein